MLHSHHKASLGRKGFALVVSLALMGLLLMLMISLSLLSSVELSVGTQDYAKSMARKNALLGLNIAIGELQEQAGADQRVTARADILEGRTEDKPTESYRYWTGVWNTDPSHPTYAQAERIGWLVSGDVSAENGHKGDDSTDAVLLVGAGSAVDGEQVRAPRVEIDSGQSVGGYAYWVGDEGVKASYTPSPGNLTVNFEKNELTAAPPSLGITILDGLDDAVGGDWELAAPAIYGASDLPLYHGKINATLAKRYFHDLSFHSKGVLTDVRNGGLKYDLSTAFEDSDQELPELGGDLPSLELFRSYYSLYKSVKDERGRFSIEPRTQSVTEHEVRPLLLLFQGNFGVVPSKNGLPVTHADHTDNGVEILKGDNPEFILTMRPMVVLANPYDVDLEPADYEIVWKQEEGSANLAFTINPRGTGRYDAFDVLNLLGGSLRLRIEGEPFRAGEVKLFTLAEDGARYDSSSGVLMENTDGGIGDYLWVPTGVMIPDVNSATQPSFHDKDDGSGLSVRVLKWDWQIRPYFHHDNDATPRAPAATRFTLLLNGNEASVYESVFSGSRKSIGRIGSQYIELREALDYGYHARFKMRPSLRGRNNFPVTGEIAHAGGDARGMPWLANINIRSPRMTDLRETFSDFDWNTHPAFYWQGHSTGWDNGGLQRSIWEISTEDDGKRTTWGSHSVGTRSDAATEVSLYHIRRSPVLSMGDLNHVNAAPEYGSSYSVGHSWASMFEPFATKDFHYLLNEALWDRFFFSGLINGDSLNPRMRLLSNPEWVAKVSLDKPNEVAAALMADGAFNVNSTSVEAWKTVLSSLRERGISVWESSKEAGGILELEGLSNPILSARLPNGLPLDDQTDAKEQVLAQWNGFRNLSDEQINTLAGQIVNQVRLRGPFLSLADFVNRDVGDSGSGPFAPRMMGALQAAIDNDQAVVVDGISYDHQVSGVINSSADGGGVRLNPVMGNSEGFPESSYANPLPNDEAVVGLSTERGAPGYLTQADILGMIGSFISVRSDTFRIRAYGDFGNKGGSEYATAVCEAIVQRIPEPVVASDTSPLNPADGVEGHLGRKFRIVSFRWLSADEI